MNQVPDSLFFREQARIAAEQLTGLKPVGNMMWFMDKEQEPRQLTKAERILYKQLENSLYREMCLAAKLDIIKRIYD